ncbi:MAG: hypothetical protein UX12_C0001G0006 [Candidatus Collierbacteria bacterium GW2011_GWC1_45_47]|uniref:Uncharacterized protein n=4 Tax=Candidatus Collieribacteriota TaxID=1752725 RepID=A0A0G1HIQ1_9BACT|nr:MAG: hypothetical protein UW23_C0006G0009 [Candidatus Collierbacteria bacterium GW2011_GWA1_44_12]KKT39531.1 MAG: hypothetical protein UW26_C0001G0018 [Candidatus Collierbacteria bacterium GW2011_GWF1_44_12]KKT47091.1 MAG: hypothetical protein UW35_C0003G0028 [Candidatus Collierbacteria bacterium GW2011_GWF2_44_15]KKT68239.1 MAG: hypothetical protein UW62_C0001G0003 [Candidatus Collierbacteria bacterium GW2011_GWB1_44_35]KKU09810.1 MAG: hypothetical protein UX12_C0001G0006 [Candidatus Collie
MDDNWLDEVLNAAASTVAERTSANIKKDEFRTELRSHLEALIYLPFPPAIASILEDLKRQGYHRVDERVYPARDRKDPLAVGLTDDYFLAGTKNLVVWKTIARRVAVWPEPRLVSSKDKNLVIAVDIVPVDPESAIFKVTISGVKIEGYNPEDFDLGQLRRLVSENIKKNCLLPRRRE